MVINWNITAPSCTAKIVILSACVEGVIKLARLWQRRQFFLSMDTENTDDEVLVKDAYTYITRKVYPEGCSVNRKRVIRNKALKFEVAVSGELLYRHKQKGKVSRPTCFTVHGYKEGLRAPPYLCPLLPYY